ncbi:MAG TPA: tRNA preQ1(34) S-adenosylmethionine ribosyltransferase-isomerase QueA [Bryobacterales bacterium]|nr:tRNA preQ1(34) S-adenosylmethionine ribosyltransferase-isomerase QueA [Bryobacterales bacterium]
MLVSDFDYALPEELIAQRPLDDRAAARMLVVDRAAATFADRSFRNFPDYLRPGDCVVVNNSKVFPARLFGKRASGTARIEVLLTRQSDDDPAVWEALVRPGRKVPTGAVIHFDEGLQAEVIGRGEFGERTLRFSGAADLLATLDRIGHVPLPPYIRRPDDTADRAAYQTVYARPPGSVAAPTAGLHFTPEILARVEAAGARLAQITLHVGLGTFQPVHGELVEEHRMHRESYEIPPGAAEAIRGAARVVAVGTTTVRTLEHAARAGPLAAGRGETGIFIYPGFAFRATGALLTNFHLPRSTLLMLVCAFGGRELVLEAYRHAVAARYRFYSYGDCMLLV